MKISTLAAQRAALGVLVFDLGLCAAWPRASAVSSANAQAEGVFTAAQAARGAALYAKSCAECHGKNLEGTTSTALAGSIFASKWADGKHSIDDLYFVIRTQMPYGAPGTLTVTLNPMNLFGGVARVVCY